MQNLSNQIKIFQSQLAMGITETPLAVISRRQANLIFYYSHTNAAQSDMESFSKRNSTVPEQAQDNLRIFMNLIDEKTNGRQFDSVQGAGLQ